MLTTIIMQIKCMLCGEEIERNILNKALSLILNDGVFAIENKTVLLSSISCYIFQSHDMLSLLSFPGPFDPVTDQLFLSIGNNAIRKKIASAIKANYVTAIHPAATLSKLVTIQEGTVVMGGVVINADTTIGKHCIINTAASADHDCIIEDFVHISPHAALCGGVTVGEGAHIGTGAIIIPGKKIGAHSIIGAGAVVLRDIPANVVAVGNPAKVIRSVNR